MARGNTWCAIHQAFKSQNEALKAEYSQGEQDFCSADKARPSSAFKMKSMTCIL